MNGMKKNLSRFRDGIPTDLYGGALWLPIMDVECWHLRQIHTWGIIWLDAVVILPPQNNHPVSSLNFWNFSTTTGLSGPYCVPFYSPALSGHNVGSEWRSTASKPVACDLVGYSVENMSGALSAVFGRGGKERRSNVQAMWTCCRHCVGWCESREHSHRPRA